MRVVEDYVHRTGEHCASTALRNLLAHHGHDLSEGMIFGLASGLGFFYLRDPSISPTRMFHGRTPTLEADFGPNTGMDVREVAEPDDEVAWQRLRASIDAGHPGTCVNILSIVVHCGLPFLAPYGASKAALLYTTKNAANALARHRIRVNGINVGWMDTPGEDVTQQSYHGRPGGWLAAAEASMPFGMLVKPQHVARQAAFFLGPQSGVVTGAILDFDQQVVGAYPDTDKA